MSFMTVSGMVLHCHKCSSYSTVAFVEGSKLTQIGDAGVIHQNELNAKYHTTEKYHVEGLLCSTCYQAVAPDDIEKKRWSAALQLDNITCDLENLKKFYEEGLFEYLTTALIQWLDAYSFKCQDAEVFNSIVNDKNIEMKGRLKKLLTRHMYGAYEQYLRKADEMLSIDSLPQVITSVEEYRKDCNLKLVEANEVYRDLGTRDFIMSPLGLSRHEF